jgi:hypothetical protein
MSCPVDGRPLTGNAVICSACETTLERALGDLEALLDDLDTTLTRQSRKRPARGSYTADGPPLPYDERASEAARDLRTLLKDWVSLAAEGLADEGRFVSLPMPATAKTLSSWLMHHVHWLACHDTGPDAYSEIVAAVNNIRRTIDIAPDTVYVGPCGSLLDDVECTETLYAREGSDTVRCRTCTTVWDIAERTNHHLNQAEHVAQTITILTRSFSLKGIAIDSDRLSKWVARGYLKPHGIGARKRPTYIVAHVARLITLWETGQKLTPWPAQEQETA